MYPIQLDVNVANGVAIDFANDALPGKWMEVYPKLFNLFYIKIVIDRINQLFDLLLTLHRNNFNMSG